MAIPDYPGVDAREAPQPDIVNNPDAALSPANENRSNAALEPTAPLYEGENANNEDQPRKKWTFSRVMCCCGWIFLCPIFTCIYSMRERPVDKDDMVEDPCLPCYG